MSKKKRPNTPNAPRPVVHGDVFRAFVAEAQSIGNEVVARREYDADVVEFLKEKGIFDEWAAWRQTKVNAPQS